MTGVPGTFHQQVRFAGPRPDLVALPSEFKQVQCGARLLGVNSFSVTASGPLLTATPPSSAPNISHHAPVRRAAQAGSGPVMRAIAYSGSEMGPARTVRQTGAPESQKLRKPQWGESSAAKRQLTYDTKTCCTNITISPGRNGFLMNGQGATFVPSAPASKPLINAVLVRG